METNEEKRKYFQFQTKIGADPVRIFPLLCPVREYEWIPNWHCELIYSRSGIAEPGCVFATDFGDQFGREIWVVSHYEPCRKIAFVRTGLLRTMRFDITLYPQNDHTLLQSCQEITWLDVRGNMVYTQEDFHGHMEGLMTMLKHFLQTGTMLEKQ